MKEKHTVTLLLIFLCQVGCDTPIQVLQTSSQSGESGSPISATSTPPFNSKPTHSAYYNSLIESPIISYQADPSIASSIDTVQYQVRSSQNVSLNSWTDTPSEKFQIFNLDHVQNGSTYKVCLRAKFKDGDKSQEICSDGWTIDITPPQIGALTLSAITGTYLEAQWLAGLDSISGIASYQVSLSSGSPITVSPETLMYRFSSLSLVPGSDYSFSVAALDLAGNVSVVNTLSAHLPKDYNIQIQVWGQSQSPQTHFYLCYQYDYSPKACYLAISGKIWDYDFNKLQAYFPKSTPRGSEGCTYDTNGDTLFVTCGYHSYLYDSHYCPSHYQYSGYFTSYSWLDVSNCTGLLPSDVPLH